MNLRAALVAAIAPTLIGMRTRAGMSTRAGMVRAGHVFSGFGIIHHTSNGVGAANFNATGQQDTSYGVSDVVGYAPVLMNRLYATGVTDPPVLISVPTETLRAYAAPPGLNMGSEQTIGRRLYQRGLAPAPFVGTFSMSGSTSANWAAASVSPQIGGNMCTRSIAYGNARKAEVGRDLDFVVCHVGENDTGSSGAANAVRANLESWIAAYRAGVNQPDLLALWVFNVNSTGAFAATVDAQIQALVNADPNSRRVFVDDIALASNPHYGANGYFDAGDRVVYEAQKAKFPGVAFDLEAPSAFPRLQDMAAMVTTAASPATAKPRTAPDVRDGDYQLLLITSYSTDPTYTVTPAGFVQLGAAKIQSIFSGTVFRTLSIWGRLVDQATLDANHGLMPTPTIDGGTVATTGAVILNLRGPNKWTASPVDIFATGANNANNTALSIAGGTTAVDNELAIVVSTLPSAGSSVSTCTNANLSSLLKRRESIIAQSSFIGLALHTARVATHGTVVGATAIVNSAVGVNVGAIITIKP